MIAEINTTIVDGYFEMIDNLSNVNKKALINKIVNSINTDIDDEPYKNLKDSFGTFKS